MENKIKVSVIIPVYNAEKYLAKCLDSIMNQTFEEYEVLLINDGSTDGSQNIMKDYESKFAGKMRWVAKENAGQAAARNDGLKLAGGEYIAFMDSDDYIEPDYLARLYEAAVSNDSEAVTCGYRVVDEQGNVQRTVCLSTHGAIPYGRAGMFVVWCRLYKKSFLEEHQFSFQEGGKIYEDVPFAICGKFLSRNPIVIDYEGYAYVQRPGSTMSSGAVKSSRFPYEKMTQAVQECLAAANGEARARLEYEVLHFFAGFLFLYCRKAEKKDLDVLTDYAGKTIREYFPQYAKNPYVGIFRNKEQSFVDRCAVRMFVWMLKLGMLRGFTGIMSKL